MQTSSSQIIDKLDDNMSVISTIKVDLTPEVKAPALVAVTQSVPINEPISTIVTDIIEEGTNGVIHHGGEITKINLATGTM